MGEGRDGRRDGVEGGGGRCGPPRLEVRDLSYWRAHPWDFVVETVLCICDIVIYKKYRTYLVAK